MNMNNISLMDSSNLLNKQSVVEVVVIHLMSKISVAASGSVISAIFRAGVVRAIIGAVVSSVSRAWAASAVRSITTTASTTATASPPAHESFPPCLGSSLKIHVIKKENCSQECCFHLHIFRKSVCCIIS